jgi:riboflavin kinase/FMN adenylyltransferase
MLVYRNTDLLPDFRNAVLTIGTFDGVHSGHQQVIVQMKKRAADVNGETIIVTFDPHPRTVINAASGIRLINTLEEKIELLSDKGIDHLVIVPFTEEFARLSAEDYISHFLIRYFKPHTLIIGYDHHFGKGRAGNFSLLQLHTSTYNYQLMEIPAHVLDSISVSSTRIRQAVEQGDMDIANLVVKEKSKLIPGDGVYAVDVESSDEPDKIFRGMMNIGFRPTVDGTKRMIEVNIFDFKRDIYGKTLRVFVRKFLRPEIKFSGLEELKAQLAEDKKASVRV